MKLLFVSNYWPPQHLGGYELGCSKVVQQLCRDGHNVTVLTNKNVAGTAENQDYNILAQLSDFRMSQNLLALILNSAVNYNFYNRALLNGDYDRVYLFGLNYVGFAMLFHSVGFSERVVAYVSDESYCHLDYLSRFLHRLSGHLAITKPLFNLLFRRLDVNALQSVRIVATSDYINKKLTTSPYVSKNVETIRWGIDDDYVAHLIVNQPCLSIVLGGRISLDKGTLFALKVIEEVLDRIDNHNVKVVLLGDIPSSDYGNDVLTVTNRLSEKVDVKIGYADSNQIKDEFDQGGIFLLPSMWQEPFSIFLLEAMARGMLVLGSNTGGTSEVIVDGVNGFLLAPGCKSEWTHRLSESINNWADCQVIRNSAVSTIQGEYTMTKMVNKLLSNEM